MPFPVDLTKPNASQVAVSELAFFQKVYLWMCGGLVVSAFMTYALLHSESWLTFLFAQKSTAIIVICAVQLGIVLGFGVLRNRVSATALKGLFLAYSASMGMTFSIVCLVYPSTVIFKAFICAAAIYGGMAAYGLLTKKSLQAWGSFLFMALLGLFVVSLVNMFTRSPMVDYVICFVGVLLFAGLTAYDHQKLRVIHAGGFANQDMEEKCVIQGSLELYLDFVNLFLFLVRILGNRR
ncbi:MAG: Bax inhibitor-1/YccA family protein [Deltaproteobacteria bacterium]|jgi:FtsH-binding integral membrane protein|nr:Bax inhibitor-1/YccA family protein [Deltaproteobacteria bacterium]